MNALQESEHISMLREIFVPAETFQTSTDTLTTNEVFLILSELYPDIEFTPALLATEMRIAGYVVELVGDRPLWLLERKKAIVL